MSNLTEISSDAQFNDLVSKKDSVFVLNFWASWAEPCQQMNEVFAELSGKFPALQFLKVNSGFILVHVHVLILYRLKLKNTLISLRVLRSLLYLPSLS